MESVNLEAGIVGEDERAGSKAGVVHGLEGGVGGEGDAVFVRCGDCIEAGHGLDGDGVGDGGGAEVAELALTGGGGEQAKGHGESVMGAPHALTKDAVLHRVWVGNDFTMIQRCDGEGVR